MHFGLSSSVTLQYLRLRNLRYRRLTENQANSSQLTDTLVVSAARSNPSPNSSRLRLAHSCRNLYCNIFRWLAGVMRRRRESPVHLEGHRLVHGGLVGRVSAGRGPSAPVLRRGPRRLSRRIGRTACAAGALQASRRAHRTRRQGRRRLRRVPVPRLAMGSRRHQPLHPVSAGPAQPRAAAPGVPGERAARLRVRLAPTPGQGAAVGNARHLHVVPAVRDRPGGVLPPVPGVFTADRERAGAPADRGRERARTARISTTCTARR